MKIGYKKKFIKHYNKCDSSIRIQLKEKILLFQENPFNEVLKNHSLNGKYLGLRSINITGDFRLIFREYPNGTYDFVDFIDIGTHSELY